LLASASSAEIRSPVHSRKLAQPEQKTASSGLIVWHFVQRITGRSPLAGRVQGY
jgi:hypothetical protein